MTQYMLSVHHDGQDDAAFQMSEEDMQATFKAVDEVNAELQATGAWVFGGGLQMPDSATMVRAHEGDTLITDGPFAETKEFLGGFWVIEAPTSTPPWPGPRRRRPRAAGRSRSDPSRTSPRPDAGRAGRPHRPRTRLP